MNAEGFAFWCVEAKQIFRQSYFADGLAIETSSFKETCYKIDEPQCPAFHNCMGKKEVIQSRSIWYVQKKKICWQRLLYHSLCKLVVLQTSSSAVFFIYKLFPFKDEDIKIICAGLAKYKWKFAELEGQCMASWSPWEGHHSLWCWVADSGKVGHIGTNKMEDTFPPSPNFFLFLAPSLSLSVCT